MVENGSRLEDLSRSYSVLPVLLWRLLLPSSSMRLLGSRAVGLLLVTLLPLSMLHCCWPCEALCMPSTTLTSSKGVLLSLPHSHVAPSCSPQRSDRIASNLGQQNCPAASSASSSSSQQRALLSLAIAKPHARVRVLGGGTAGRALRAERESDGLVSSLLLLPTAHGCRCSCRRRSTGSARRLANLAAGSKEPTSRQERCRSTSNSWIDSPLLDKHVASARQQTRKHLCCCTGSSTWNRSSSCVGGLSPEACLYEQRTSCKRVATRSRSTHEAGSWSCLFLTFCSTGEVHAGSASLGRLSAFIAAGMSARLLPTAGVIPPRFRIKESPPAFSQCSEKGSATHVGETATWQPKDRLALPWCWKGSMAQPATAGVGPCAVAAQEETVAYSGVKVGDSRCTRLVVAHWCCRGRITAASARCRYVVREPAHFCGAHSNRRKTLSFVDGTARNLCVSTKEASAPTPAATAAGQGGGRRERVRYPPKEERILTLPQLERELQRRHRAVGLAIKAGDAVVAFKEFDMHLRCAAATVQKWMMTHHRCFPGAQIQQQQQPCGRWRPDSIEEPFSFHSDQQQRKEGQHRQKGQGKEGEEKEVHQQEHGQSRQQSGGQRRLQQGQESREQKEDGEAVPHLHGDAETLRREVQGRQTRQKVDVVENSSRPPPSCVSTLLKLFVKSASGVLNLCCMNSSEEALRSTRDLYDIARQVLRRLKEYHLLNPLNTNVGNAFLTVAAAAGDTEAVAATLLLMQLQGARPQRKGYDALLRILLRRGEGYCRLRQADLLSHMLDQRLPPTPEQLFALLLRDAARVSAQLEKEQLAAEKVNSIWQKQKQQAVQEPPAPECRPQQQQEPVMPEDASLHVRAGRTAETQKEEEDKKEEETDRDAGVEGLTGCSEATVVRRLRGRSGNSSNPPLSAQEKESKSHAAALAAAQVALVEETWSSVHVLRDFVAAAEDALTLLQQVVSEQLPLLSEVAAGRFVASLRNLRLPPIAHISRVVIRHQAGSTAAYRHYNGQDGLPVHVGKEYASADPPEAAPAPGDKAASQEPSRIIDEGMCDSTYRARGAYAPGAAVKPCGGVPIVQERQDPTAGAGSGEEEVERGCVRPKDYDYSEHGIHPHDMHTQQQQRFHQTADPAEQALSLQRSAVCAGCGTRLQRVRLSNNERRLLRLGVLKLSAMLHPRQLRALLAFEAALTSRQLRCPAPRSATASARSVAAAAAAGGGVYEQQHHLQQEGQARQGHGDAVSPAVVGKSGVPVEVETQEPAVRIVHPCLPSTSPRSTASFCGTGQIADQGSSAKGTLNAASGSREAAFVAHNHGTAERISSQVGCAYWWRPMKRSTHAPLSSSNCRFLTSASSRFTVVLDAANIAYNSQNRLEGVFSYPQIERVRQELLGRGEKPLIILPAAYYWGLRSQRSRKSDGSNSTENVARDNCFAKSADVDSSRSSSNRIEGARESLPAGLEEKSSRLFSEACWPPEASRLWICRMGFCPLCIDEIKVPNRCKTSSRWASCSRTPGTFPAGRCLSVVGASKGGADTYGAGKASPKSPATSGSEGCSAGFLSKGGQRLMCLDRALLRLWEQEGCLFVCRSGAHDDHYHLLASLSACSGESRAAFSPASMGLRGSVVAGRVETPDDISARRQPGHAEPATLTGEKQDKGAGQLGSSHRIYGEQGTLPAGTGQHQCDAVHKPCGSVRSSTSPVKEQQHRLSTEKLLDIMLGVQRGKPGVQVLPRYTEEEGQLCGRTHASAGAATVQAQQSLWHRLWQSHRSPDDEVKLLHDFERPAAPSLLLPVLEDLITSGPNTRVSLHRDEPGAIPSAATYLGYSWDDIGCTRYLRKSGGVERMRAPGALFSSSEEADFPTALLTNDRFRDHRLSSQQRTAFKHWRQLALLPYVFQRRQTPGWNGLTVAGVSHAESPPQHTGAPVCRSARRIHGGAHGQRHDSSTKQQLQRESTASLSRLSPAAGASSTLGEVLDGIDAVTIQEHLSDGGDAAGTRPELHTREASCQGVFCSNGMLEEKKGEEDDRELAHWTARLTRRTEEDSLKIGTDVWNGGDAVSPRGRQTNEWSSDGLDFLMQRVVSDGGFSDWGFKSDLYGQTEGIKRVTRVEKVEGRGKRYVDYAGDEVVPQLFIGMPPPLTRRVQVSLKAALPRTVHPRETFNARRQAATELPLHTDGQEYPRGGSRILANSSPEGTNQTRELPLEKNTSFHSRTRAFPVVGEKYLSGACFQPEAALSLLTLYSSCLPCEDVTDIQHHWVWHIPLRKPDEEALRHADDLFETSRANVGVPHSKARISSTKSDGQQELLDGVLTIPTHSRRSWEKSSINTPSSAAECTCVSTKTDQLSTLSPKKDLFSRKDVFFDPDVLTQHSEESLRGEEALGGSDMWLGIDLAPVYQLLRAREQFLGSVAERTFQVTA